jgi:alpha-beta hydrolase superfamily lysophospholipase
LHGNCGNRREALCAVEKLVEKNIAVFCFDFAGTGNSDGEYISLGWYEALDLIVVLGQIKKMKKVKKIALWGRSMGAVTALLYTGLYD